MKVGVFGSHEWDNYMDLVRSMTIFIQESHEIGHDQIVFMHSGKSGAENMLTEYIGKTEKFLKEKNFKIKEIRIWKKLRSAIKNLKNWSFTIVCGNNNYNFMKELVKVIDRNIKIIIHKR